MIVFTLDDIVTLILLGLFILCLIIVGLVTLYSKLADKFKRKRSGKEK